MHFTKIPVLRVALVASLMLSLAGCNLFGFRSWAWHQKLTITVMTPDGPRTGSAVSAVTFELPPKWWGVGDSAGSSTHSLRDEAVVVDLGDTASGPRYLFALLKGYSIATAREAFLPRTKPENREMATAVYDKLETLRATTDLPRKLYPLLVTFDDINDPASVKRVDPDDLAATFGVGYALTSISLAITDEPVTKGKVEAVLGCLNSGAACVPLNKALPFDDPMRNILNSDFWRK